LAYENGALRTITDPFLRVTTYTYSAGDLDSIEDHTGRTTEFTIAGGKLTGVTTPAPDSKALVLDYDGGLLTGYTDLAGHRTTYTYEPVCEQIQSIQTPKGEITTFNYVDNTTLEVTDARTHVTTVIFDTAHRVQEVVNPLGERTTYSWVDGRLNTIVDAKSRRTTFVYETGMTNRTQPVKQIQFPDEGVFEYVYDTANNRLSAVVDQLDQRTTLHWDDDQRVAIEDALGHRTTFTYNLRGQVETVKNPLGYVTTAILSRCRTRPARSRPISMMRTNACSNCRTRQAW